MKLLTAVVFLAFLASAQDPPANPLITVSKNIYAISKNDILGSVAKTGRLFTVEENPRLCGWGAEIASIVADEAFWDLDGPIVRITTPHIPLPAADHLEDLALPGAARIVDKIRRVLNG